MTQTHGLRERGFSQHERGDMQAAEQSYREVLRDLPDDLDIVHALGILTVQTGRYAEGLELIGRVVRDRPSAAALADLGNALCGLARFEEAIECFDRALAVQADLYAAHLNRGHALWALGRPEEALVSYAAAIGIRPEQPSAYLKRASTLVQLGRWQDALASADQAIARGAGSAEAHTLRGLSLAGLARLEEARQSYDRALGLDPAFVPAHVNRGVLERASGRLKEALASYDAALALDDYNVEALINRAAVLGDLNRPSEALADCDRAAVLRPDRPEIELHRGAALLTLDRFAPALHCYERAIVLQPSLAEAHAGRAAALQYLQRHAEALESSDRAIALRPELASGHFNRGAALRDLVRVEDAVTSFETARSLAPEDPTTNCNLGGLLLLLGRFERGWELYEWRSKLPEAPKFHRYAAPVWQGTQELRGKTLFVYLDQGLGDTIQFSRYAKLAEACGARVVMSVQDKLRRLLSTLSPTIELLGETESPPTFDYHCPLASLPGAFATRLSSIPASARYLRAEPERVAHWRRRLDIKGFKIGICWQGSRIRSGLGRSYPLGALAAVSMIPGVRLISLQQGAGVEQLRSLPTGMRVETLGESFDAGADAFLDTAAVMEVLDLVITCDTSIAHVAGALGRPTWVLVKRVPDWRWMLDRHDNPWYPTLRVFRQSRSGDWADVFDTVKEALENLVGSMS
jgi:tetratricopeptide (TPR) repeat protein